MNYKKIKREAFKNVKHNYFKSVIVVFICTILLAGGINLSSKNILNIDLKNVKNIEILNNSYKSNSEILDELVEKIQDENIRDENVARRVTHGIISVVVNEVTTTKSFMFNIINSINKFLGGHVSVGIIIIISNICLLFFRIIFVSVIEVGRNRFFLESRRYLKTNIDRFLYPYKKKKTLHIAKILFIKNLYLFLWSFTIIGFFIKYYEYALIPYILAENPNISRKDAFKLSKELMDKEKFNLFKLDLLLLVYKIPGIFTFNLTNIFFADIYAGTLYSEFYMNVEEDKKNIENIDLISDELLNIKDIKNESYPDNNIKKHSILNINYLQEYDLNTYILFFFAFSIAGWLWEVMLHLLMYGRFVNRGTLHGPWIQIYGFGGIAILYLLRRFRKSPTNMFLSSFILCGIIEYSTAWYLETFKHLKYWDYSGYFLNLHGRICLEGLIIFGLGGCAFTYILAPILANLFNRLRTHIKNVLVAILIFIFSIDMLYSTFIKPNTGKGISSQVMEIDK